MPEVVKAHKHQFMWCELLRGYECKSSPTCNEVGDTLVLCLLSFNELRDATLSLGIVELSEKFLLYRLPTDNTLMRLKYHIKSTPSSDCMKKGNNNASIPTGGPFMTVLQHM